MISLRNPLYPSSSIVWCSWTIRALDSTLTFLYGYDTLEYSWVKLQQSLCACGFIRDTGKYQQHQGGRCKRWWALPLWQGLYLHRWALVARPNSWPEKTWLPEAYLGKASKWTTGGFIPPILWGKIDMSSLHFLNPLIYVFAFHNCNLCAFTSLEYFQVRLTIGCKTLVWVGWNTSEA